MKRGDRGEIRIDEGEHAAAPPLDVRKVSDFPKRTLISDWAKPSTGRSPW